MESEKKQREHPWYKKWFNEYYLLLYHQRNLEDAEKQAKAIITTLHPGPGCRVLDLACGAGRYMKFFQGLGCRVTGIDLSSTLIKRGKKENPGLHLVTADMRALPILPGTFNIVLSLFTSFGYFEEEQQNLQVIDEVYRTLKAGGFYWLDFLNAQCVEKNLVPENLSRVTAQLLAREKRKIEAGRIVKDIFFESEDHQVLEQYRESVRLFSRQELENMMQISGFRVIGCFGDYDRLPWNEDSPRTIIYGVKES